jgi:hypothetical protein
MRVQPTDENDGKSCVNPSAVPSPSLASRIAESRLAAVLQ